MLENAPHPFLRLASESASNDGCDERMQIVRSAAQSTRGLRIVFYDNGAASQGQSGNQDVAFLIFATAVVGLIVLCYVVCMYHYVRWCLCNKPRPGFSDDDPDGEANSAVRARAELIFHLSTRQRRAVLEAFFSDTSKAISTNELPSKKNKLSTLDSGVDDSCDKEIDEPAPPLPTSEGTSSSFQEIVCVSTLSESHHSADVEDDNNQHEVCAVDREAPIGASEAEATTPSTPDTLLSVGTLCGQDSQSSPVTLKKSVTSTKPSFLPKWRLFQRNEQLSTTRSSGLENEKLESLGDTTLVENEKHHFDLDNEEEDSVCAICLCEYEEGEAIIQAKHCSHLFHKDCILEWLEKHDMCPICREHMITKDEVDAAANIVVGKERMIRAVASYSTVSPTVSPSPRRRLQASQNEGRVRSSSGSRTRSRRHPLTLIRGANSS